MTDNTMDKRKMTKLRTLIYQTLHRKQKTEEHEPGADPVGVAPAPGAPPPKFGKNMIFLA